MRRVLLYDLINGERAALEAEPTERLPERLPSATGKPGAVVVTIDPRKGTIFPAGTRFDELPASGVVQIPRTTWGCPA